MNLSQIASTPYVKTGIAVLIALLAYRFIDVIWFALFLGGGYAVVHHFISKAGGPKKAWQAFIKWAEIDLT